MKPDPRLTIQPMTDHDSAEAILTDLACDFGGFAAIIIAVGSFALLLIGLRA